MPIEIREPFSATVPEGSIIGIVGLKGAGKSALLGSLGGRLIGPGDPLNFSPVPVLALDNALGAVDPLVKARAALAIERARRQGTTVFLVSHDEPLLQQLSDEIWWLHEGRLQAKGDPREVLPRYRAFIAERFVEWGRGLSEPVDVNARRGDQHAEITALEIPAVLNSGEPARIHLAVRFHEPVADPVIGIMIRTRVGFEVYGTNTQLEGLKLGPQQPGSTIALDFDFRCELCPGNYTLTAACHDPDGTAHDWLDDALAFAVSDTRYTAGVANLRAVCRKSSS